MYHINANIISFKTLNYICELFITHWHDDDHCLYCLCCVYQGCSCLNGGVEGGWLDWYNLHCPVWTHAWQCLCTYIWFYNTHQCYPMNCKTYFKLDISTLVYRWTYLILNLNWRNFNLNLHLLLVLVFNFVVQSSIFIYFIFSIVYFSLLK